MVRARCRVEFGIRVRVRVRVRTMVARFTQFIGELSPTGLFSTKRLYQCLCAIFRVQIRVRVQGSGFRVQGSGFRVQGSGFRVRSR